MTILELDTPRRHGRAVRAPRLPFDELEHFIHLSFGPDPDAHHVQVGGPRLCTDSFIGRICGLNRRTVMRYRREGIPLWSADHLAVHIGAHPIDIWREFHSID